jgi:SpoIID/LytB domain protein
MRKYFIAAIFAALLCVPRIYASSLDDYYSSDISRALKSYAEDSKKSGFDRMALFNLASVQKEFGMNADAVESYRRIVAIADNEYRAHFELAKAYYFTGAYNYAEEEIKNLVFKNIVNWEVYYWWGCILLEEGKLDDALEKFNSAVAADKYKNLPYIKISELYERRGDIDNAIKYCRLAIKFDRTYTELNRRIAALYEKKNDRVDAYVYWRRVNEVEPKDVTALDKMKQFMANIPFLRQKAVEYIQYKKDEREKILPPEKSGVKNSGAITKVHVGIMENASSISFKCGSNFDFVNDRLESIFSGIKLREYNFGVDKTKNKPFFTDGAAKVYFDRQINIERDNPESTTVIYNIQYAKGFYWANKKDTTYRGDFQVLFRGSALTLINIVNMEEYLYGVVPAEIPPSWPMEALKAQAVAARTYTFKHMGRHESEGFDVCNTQHCAVYAGVNGETKATNEAVDTTRGQVLYGSNYKMLDTFYSEDCGGHTQDVSEVWGMKKVGSLAGVYDGKKSEWNFPLQPFDLEEYVRSSPDVYCKTSGALETSFRWIRYLDADDLAYYVDRNGDIGRIMDIIPVRRAHGGALVKVRIVGDKGTKNCGYDAMRNVLGKIRSNMIKWEYLKDDKGYIKEIYIYGAGWGHGVGMCQRGVKGMADENEGYESILYHYFPGSYIRTKY